MCLQPAAHVESSHHQDGCSCRGRARIEESYWCISVLGRSPQVQQVLGLVSAVGPDLAWVFVPTQMESFLLLVPRLPKLMQGLHLLQMDGPQTDMEEVAQHLQPGLPLLLESASAQPARVAASHPLSREAKAPQSLHS